MKIIVRKSVKLDLPHVLDFIAAWPEPLPSSILLPALMRRFGCKKRAAQDALAILIKGGWLDRQDDPEDRRRKIYAVTKKGRDDLSVVDGWRHMRWARWQYSRTSTRARKRQRVRRTVGFA